jgi:multidrug resistance efflux pump
MRLVQGLLRMAFIPFERGVSFSAFVLGRSRSLLLVSLTALWPGAAFAATFDCVMEPSLTVKLGSPVASILSRVLVERGDRVVRGQVVAQIEASVEEAVVAANEERAKSTAEIEAKQTILKQKSSVMQRKGDLLTRNSGSVQDAENAPDPGDDGERGLWRG